MDKALRNLLTEKKSLIIEKWCREIINTYPKDTAQFLREKRDEFANPIGNTINQGIEQTFTALVQENKEDEVHLFLKDMIKVRAVQSFTASQAVSFVFPLKRIIREELGKVAEEERMAKALLEFETQIDQLALASFDIYSECRDKLADLKTMELRNMTYRLLQQADLVTPRSDTEPEEPNSEPEPFLVNTKRKEVVT
ncbi:hypothetical protein Desde_0269 [Desulfitobacterium dehalogenans ATCC 51507]|uniref:RsbT co-antagonist protein RsbRD N-terminal domain-containing protein n=1 Tax=Desulfitobacterium dehalogenans (strain ATCC 51507 / DSM 9161 / JW/IU-DC1) TaxID=756499 RepID=I4A456_DESDJ|nr:RsbRD N-terminal domain-containing protein [Desulfitobacterium dehalogenans]AFL98740.1 hypothetical protein Desde_0269 [Desulfitobacterium dehalogenans ATCC 51507]